MELSLFSWLKFVPRARAGFTPVRAFEGASIRCACCGTTIRPGDPVTLHVWRGPEPPPGYAVVYINEPVQVVVCTTCEESSPDLVLVWAPTPEGEPRIVCTNEWNVGPLDGFGLSGTT